MGSLFGEEIHEVSGGEVRSLTGADLERRFADSWARLRYLEWSDTEPPIVGVSGDTGWMLVRVHARRVTLAGEPLPDFDAAWIGIYQRTGGAWKLRAISSSLIERVQPARTGPHGREFLDSTSKFDWMAIRGPGRRDRSG